MILICCLVLALSFSIASVDGSPQMIGSLPNLEHGISGTLYMGQRQTGGQYYFRIEGFYYDGFGPDAYVYVYSRSATVTASGGGTIIPLTSSQNAFTFGRRYSNEVLEVDIPLSFDVADIGTFTIWCQRFQSLFTQLSIPASVVGSIVPDIVLTSSVQTTVSDQEITIMPTASIQPTSTSQAVPSTAGSMPTIGPTSVPTADYHNCEVLSPNLQVSWTLDTANDIVFVKLCGCINSAEYMAFGISGSDSASRMLKADVVVTWLNETSAGAVDYYLTGYAQCRPRVEGGEIGACPDDVQGGINNAILLGANLDGNSRCVEYRRPTVATEIQDKNMSSESFIVWGIGPRDPDNNYALKHFERLVQTTKIAFDRAPANNCPPQMCSAGEVCPWKEEVIDARNIDATFVAKIGQSGGSRGYFGITGNSGWGIGWYINDSIIPVLRVTRGNTYTFQVYGGRDKNQPSSYHPFYLTDRLDGGRLGNSESAKAQEVVYAGFDGDTPTAVGDLCMYEETIPTSGDIISNCSTEFTDYFQSLVEKTPCDELTPGVLEWTPDKDTPDLLYYQCATHVFFGWKIQVEGVFPGISPSTSDPLECSHKDVCDELVTPKLPSTSSLSIETSFILPTQTVSIVTAEIPATTSPAPRQTTTPDRCPPMCTRQYCRTSRTPVCSIRNESECTVITCKACYYSETVRTLPSGCKYECGMGRGSEGNWRCARLWSRCIRKKDREIYGKPDADMKRPRLFKCYSPPRSMEGHKDG